MNLRVTLVTQLIPIEQVRRLLVRNWMLLVYKIPSEPTAGRVFVWRKLKKLGAVLLHDSVWVLPASAQTREQFGWIAAEIIELNGEATVWESKLVLEDEEERLIGQFQAMVQSPYKEILTALKRRDPDLTALSRRYQQIRAQDYFNHELGRQVRESLIAAKGDRK